MRIAPKAIYRFKLYPYKTIIFFHRTRTLKNHNSYGNTKKLNTQSNFKEGKMDLGESNFLTLLQNYSHQGVYQVTLVVKNLPAKAGDVRDAGSISGSGRSPGGGQGNPLQYSCLENSMEREAWWAIVHSGMKSWI